MSLPAIIACIFTAKAGLAFPEEMGKTTKLELTTGRPPRTKGQKQAASNMVKVGERIYPAKASRTIIFGYGLIMAQDAGSKIDREAKKRLIPLLEQQVVELGGEPIALEDIKGMMMEEK